MSWSDQLFHFYKNLKPPADLPKDIAWLYPQQDPEVMELVRRFLEKYFHDNRKRRLMLGINPGRFGAGVTGINFTAPRQLTEICGIAHHLKMQSELSAEFIYDMIAAYGGPEAFYGDYFIGSVCPLGFVRQGKNINYYDDKELLRAVEPFIISSIEAQLQLRVEQDQLFCIGGEKNFRYLSVLNQRFGWFGQIIPLPHPRFIMQYRRKEKEQFIRQYLQFIKKTGS